MRKAQRLPGFVPHFIGNPARPVFTGDIRTARRYVTRRDWSPVLWALAALGLAVVSFLGVSALLLGA